MSSAWQTDQVARVSDQEKYLNSVAFYLNPTWSVSPCPWLTYHLWSQACPTVPFHWLLFRFVSASESREPVGLLLDVLA